MRVSSIFLLALFVCPIVVRATTIERPITSAVRAGRSSTTARIPAGGAFNGERFLITWVSADRDGQAMLLDRTGEPVSAVTGLPFRPKYSFWNGDVWIVIGEGWVRIDADGELLDREPRSLGVRYGSFSSATWTGTSLIVAMIVAEPTFPYTLFIATFDAQMHLSSVREHDVTSVAHLAWDGQAALLLYRRSGESTQLRANILDRDGAIQRSKTIVSNAPIAVGTTGDGDGYRVMTRRSSATSSAFYTMLHLDHDLAVRQNFYTIGRAAKAEGEGPTLAWDGSAFTFFYVTGKNPTRELYGVRLSRDGVVLEDALVTTYFDNYTGRLNEVSSVAAGGTHFMFYMPLEPVWGLILRMREGNNIAELATSATRELERGAFAQAGTAAASGATQALVAWRERPAPGGTDWVYATRVDASGSLRDPQSLIVGVDACGGVGPSVASVGDSFLASWRTAQGVMFATVEADGVVSQRTRIGSAALQLPCQGRVKVMSNGTAYLVAWATYKSGEYAVFAKRVSATGEVLDAVPLELGTAWDWFEGASNGNDYLLAWDGETIRVDAGGNRRDPLITRQPSPTRPPRTSVVWWNGSSYSIVERELSTQARFRIHRVASNGTKVKIGEWMPYITAYANSLGDGICEGSTCTFVEHSIGQGTSILRKLVVTDDETPSIDWVDTIPVAPTRWSPSQVPATPFSINSGRLFAVYPRYVLEQPYSGISRVFLTAMDPSRTRVFRR